jgi:pimeloyl-ACP methyl ester carboxylesterase
MNPRLPTFLFVIVVLMLWNRNVQAEEIVTNSAASFAGPKTSWHGFARHDFLMNEQELSLQTIQAADDEHDGIKHNVKGLRRCIVVTPAVSAPGNPWSWRGVYWDHMPQTEIELLQHGFCVAYIESSAELKPGRAWDAWYAYLTTQHGLSPRPAFVGMSRGGEYAYTWASANPDKVSCIYADNPGSNPDALSRLGELARHDVPILHVCGTLDPILGVCSTAIENIYHQFGGRISLMIKDGAAHHPHSLGDPQPIVDFIIHSVGDTNRPVPAIVPNAKFTRTSFYSPENTYRYYPSEGVYITCRGPRFVPCYDRYQFGLTNVPGFGVNVIVPEKPAPGNPWVFRAAFVNRDAAVDLGLLARGFFIVTGPVPFDDGPVPAQWNLTYQYFTNHGFAPKPVLEGAGAAAGEAYAWAMENPDKVCCIYSENPILHSNLSKLRLLDNLDRLAKAGIPLLSVCGSRDPAFNDNTRVVQERYRQLGGPMTVILKPGAEHYPLAPDDPAPVVDFITKAALN